MDAFREIYGQMADRFRQLLDRRDAARTEPEAERLRFDAIRRRAHLRLVAIIWAAIAVAAFAVTALTGLGPFGYAHPGAAARRGLQRVRERSVAGLARLAPPAPWPLNMTAES